MTLIEILLQVLVIEVRYFISKCANKYSAN
jgi:hypothetical protein